MKIKISNFERNARLIAAPSTIFSSFFTPHLPYLFFLTPRFSSSPRLIRVTWTSASDVYVRVCHKWSQSVSYLMQLEMIMSGKTLQLLQRHISSPPSVPAILILTENRQLLKTTASKLHRRKEKKSAWKILTDRPTHTEIHTKHMQLVNTQFSSREQKRSTCMRIEQPQM